MATFSYSAVLESGRRVKGTIHSRTRRDAIEQLLNRGCHPLSVDSASDGRIGFQALSRRISERVSVSSLAVFTRQFASLLKAGLTVVQALSTLRRQSHRKHLIRVIQDLEESLSREAGTLADALDRHPRVFDAVYCGLVRAGEEGGDLEEVLRNLAGHLTRSARLRGQVLGAFLYPIFILVLGAAAIFVLMTCMIPRFQELFFSFGQTLPWPTQVLIAVSNFLAVWWWAVLLALAAAIVMVLVALRRPTIRTRFDRHAVRLPVVGTMFLKLEIARIARTLGTLLASGVRILESLRITGRTARNLAIRATFSDMVEGVSGGETLATVVERTRMYPPIVINLIRTGEETGELPDMLMELSGIYEDEAERSVANAVKLLEPTLIVLMGGIIAAIVAAVMLPVFQANVMVQ